jgi:hypothetical protein
MEANSIQKVNKKNDKIKSPKKSTESNNKADKGKLNQLVDKNSIHNIKSNNNLINDNNNCNNILISKNKINIDTINIIHDKAEDNIINNNFSIFDEKNINYSDDINSNSLNNNSNISNINETNNTNTNNNSNSNSEHKLEDNKFTESKPSEKILKMKMKDEEFINFEKDLKDYLRRTISNKRQKIFFNNILPESLEIMQKLFVRDNNVSTNIDFPIYRNDYLEVTLSIQQGGKIKKKITYLRS